MTKLQRLPRVEPTRTGSIWNRSSCRPNTRNRPAHAGVAKRTRCYVSCHTSRLAQV